MTEDQSDAWQAWNLQDQSWDQDGPGKKRKNPMPPKEKERKKRKVKEKASGARMEKVMARITFPMQLQKV